MTYPLFWDVMQSKSVVSYRRSSDCLTLEDRTDRLSRNVGKYQSTLRNTPEERRSKGNSLCL